ncbi:right-handed parallel beta-helix repeat-containing protein [Halomonas sp. PAMB 3232]|uniref:right-handed parallel beta-helix repeat-containing protein n=1 Tax=Halomonas sp. PAMB 3232 TaxID=3075221 RepID=UPI00289957A2|nr:right-handed parallel beta-helix repeat-containing protein [Halomonas sp. PAMB 3232]WNL38187.1 right-handed parallel beta-helix repeat-containing protein [Halomonas sp. PAMB 3232]
MKKIATLVFTFVSPALATSLVHADDVSELVWESITFGQSTDLNFGSTILPDKVGTNEVTHDGEPVASGALLEHVTIESRGGKLANSHEGGTFYYTTLPTDQNFVLSATLTLEQLGPETGATPNRQEGAGIIVRDVLGAPRANPQPVGHEEFPAASNMVMNLLRSHSRENDGLTNATAVYRVGIQDPWGNPGNLLSKEDYAEGMEYGGEHRYHMSLARTDEHFSVSFDDGDQVHRHELSDAPANLVKIQDPDHQYIGFFAARNARLGVSDITLELSDADTQQAKAYEAPPMPLVWSVASPELVTTDDYALQAIANYAGTYSVSREGEALGEAQKLDAGELYRLPLEVNELMEVALTFDPSDGPGTTQEISLTLEPASVADPYNLYVSPEGREDQPGDLENPLDLASAITRVAPGGTIHMADGEYEAIEIPLGASGSPGALKRLSGEGADVRFTGMVSHNAHYWQLDHLEVDGERLIVHGSHNVFEHIVTHGAPDTGFQITSPDDVGRALWASHNTVRYSESYNNEDASGINADGFAAKMRIGDGNSFDHCLSHHNIDDGWDLFNKVEDGPNGVVTITNSIAFNNGQTLNNQQAGGNLGNGFKLGGEGLPVAHTVEGNLSFNNGMDGFTDNFNSGPLTISNNVAIDNARFNFIVRQSPYGDQLEPATLTDNVSLHLLSESQYHDSVHGDIKSGNWFIQEDDVSDADAPFDKQTLDDIKTLLQRDTGTVSEQRERALQLQRLVFD